MLKENIFALKEWAVTVDYLAKGRQIFLLRKGGLDEQTNGFLVEHSEFFLFPTYTHQTESSLNPIAKEDFIDTKESVNLVTLTYYGTVEEVIHISKIESLRHLDGLHSLNWPTVRQRFYYRNHPGLCLLVLRIYKRSRPHHLPYLTRYNGCRSWVKLGKAISTTSLENILSDEEFEQQRMTLHRCL